MRKQKQRLTKLVADMKANEEDLNTNKQNNERIQQELDALGDDLPELSPKKKRQLQKKPADKNYGRVQQVSDAMDDEFSELSPKKKRQLSKTRADQSTSFMDTKESSQY